MALGLSNSVPGPCLEQENILQEPDISESSHFPVQRKILIVFSFV